MNRRRFLTALAALPLRADELPPVRAITRGPKFHWFGYYDKLQFDPSSRYALGCQGSFEHRLPTADDSLRIGMVDLEDNNRWIDLGETSAWSWHQTCMLQWLPGSDREIIWNDRIDGRFVSHIADIKAGTSRVNPSPIYCLSPDAKWALATDFRRLFEMRPETGYAGVPDPNRDSLAPDNAGIWRVNLASGKSELILSYAAVAAFPNQLENAKGAKHWVNHLLIAPDGKRFVFLHRWRPRGQASGFVTRMFTASADGTDLRLIDSYGKTSHFIWRDASHLLAWCWQPSHQERFYLLEDPPGKVEAVAPDVLTRNGHCTYLRGNRWILTDTSPDRERKQHPYLFDTMTNKAHPLGHFYSAPEYTGFWRCDTTPRASPDGRKVIFDSPHGGNGRQMYLVDVSGIVGDTLPHA